MGALIAAPLAFIWMFAGPITYILAVVQTWQGKGSVLWKLFASLTLDMILAALWPGTWIVWIIAHLNGGATPIRTVLGF